MPYFSKFNYLLYPDFLDPNKSIVLKDITSRVVRKISPYDDKAVFYKYTMLEGETLESISIKLYGTQEYYWTILLANNLFDRFYDFPLPYREFGEYIVGKYGSAAAATQQFKYWVRPNYETYLENENEDKAKNFQEVSYTGATSPLNKLTIGGTDYDSYYTYSEYQNGASGIRLMRYSQDLLEWETVQNEKKRQFYVVTPSFINTFVAEFERLISQ
jgi:hypothetical protein